MNGRGVEALGHALSHAIDWDSLSRTTRPELFQRIQDEIERRRQRGDVVLYVEDLHRSLGNGDPDEDECAAIRVVTEQLAAQGIVACSRMSNGEAVIVLQVHQIERYAGSLIVAARNNPRGVPALELLAIAQPSFAFPGILANERLERPHERAILDCTIRLLVEHGVCFEHEALLVFPTLFSGATASLPEAPGDTAQLPHAVSLYYDFSGAIDNIYASLIAWLVVAKDFGRLRLWADRAEFEVANGGLCGLRKVARPGGFAHVDVYFEAETPARRRDEFISFVEAHLDKYGVEILEHVSIQCPCGEAIPEETLRKRMARGDKDVPCPVCEQRHALTEGATTTRKRDPKIQQHTWALRSLVAKASKEAAQAAAQRFEVAASKPVEVRPLRLLHLSDLHFDGSTPVDRRLEWLRQDLKYGDGFNYQELDYLVVSGDFTDKGSNEGFEKAYEFVSGLTSMFSLSGERCILVPGNHDVAEPLDAFTRHRDAKGLRDGEWVKQGDIFLARDPAKYPLRFKPFSDHFYHKFLQQPYPTDPANQGRSIPFWETGIQFLTLNSCWEIDEFDRRRAGVHPDALATALAQADKQMEEARQAGQLGAGVTPLRIAVWHHAVTAPDYKMKSLDFMAHLQNRGVKLALHGDVHEDRRELFGHWHPKKIHVVGAGSFGARGADRPESIPRLYNLLELERDFSRVRVYTRRQKTPDGAWDGYCEWPEPKGGEGRVAYYDVSLR